MTASIENMKGQAPVMESVTWGELTWLDIEQPTQSEMEYLAQNYSFNSFDLEDCLSKRQQSKLDVYKDYLFFIFQFSVWDGVVRVSKSNRVSVFIGNGYLITIHDGQLKPLVNLFRDCKAREEIRQENLSSGSGYLLYRILDRVIDAYFPILNSVLAWMDEVEDAVFDENTETGQEVAALRRDIITQRRIVHSFRAASIELEKQINRFSKIDLSVQFGDFMDHVNKAFDTLDEYKEIVDVFKDTDFVLSTDRLNHIMRVLTIISTIMLPLIVLSGLWSMNVPLPLGADPGGHHYFFYVMIAVLLSVSLGMLYFFHRRHWI